MKFLCPQCNTRYAVPDEKVPADTAVRFTCKTCSHVIRLRRSEGHGEAAANASASAPAAPSNAPPVVNTRVTPMADFAPKAEPVHPSPTPAASSPAPLPSSAAEASQQANYLEAPPGEATRVFMATAGLFKRRRNHRVAAVAGVISTLLLAGVVGADIAGIWQIPGMGIVYDVTGVADPNVDRAIERTESKLARSDLTPEQQNALRAKLMGLQQQQDDPPAADGDSASEETARARRHRAQPRKTHDAAPESPTPEGAPAAAVGAEPNIYNDARKSAAVPTLPAVTEMQTPALPEGITQEAIFKVISDNNSSMSLCMGESMRKGEQLKGRMELELTIAPSGLVTNADVVSPEFRSSAFGACTVRRIKTWRFPAFTGEPVTVVFPYVLSTTM